MIDLSNEALFTSYFLHVSIYPFSSLEELLNIMMFSYKSYAIAVMLMLFRVTWNWRKYKAYGKQKLIL